ATGSSASWSCRHCRPRSSGRCWPTSSGTCPGSTGGSPPGYTGFGALGASHDVDRGAGPVGAAALRLVPATLGTLLQRLLLRAGARARIRGGSLRGERRREGRLRARTGIVVRHREISLAPLLARRIP